jgi:acetyl esterase
MALDPQAQAVLEQIAALNLPPRWTLSPEEARRQFEARMALVPPGEPVHDVSDRTIPGPAGEIPVRVYRPRDEVPLPALVYYHGGGWVVGSIASHDPTCRALANAAGCLVISVDYRLAPEHKFPAAAEDAYAAARWVVEHATEMGVDPTRVAVGGDSAGGNLAAVVCLMARERGGPPLAFQLLVYPVTDFRFDTVSYRVNGEGYLLTTRDMEWFWNHYLPDPSAGSHPYASPLRAADLRGLPPALVITAEYDPLRDEGEAYAERLRQAGVPVTLARYEGVFHGFFGMGHLLDKARAAVRQSGEALRAAFGMGVAAD